jgi:hypothetical protein
MRTYSYANAIVAFQECFVRGRILLVGHEFSIRSGVNTGIAFHFQMRSTRLLFYSFNMSAFWLLSFVYALNMEVLYKMNSKRSKRMAVNATR